jgi:hypothetical protein
MSAAQAEVGLRNPALRGALAAHAQGALGLLDDYAGAGGGVPDVEEDVWVRHGPAFLRERRSQPRWRDALPAVRQSLQALPTHGPCLAALGRDPIIAGQLGTAVAFGLVARRWRAEDLVEEFVARLAEAQRGFVFHEAGFASAYAALERSLYDTHVTVEAVAPLPGFRSAVDRIILAEDLRVETLTDEDVRDALRAGALSSQEGLLLDPPRFGAKAVVRVPKLVTAPLNGDAPVPPLQAANNRIEEAMRALAAFRDGRARRAGTIVRSPHWLLREAVASLPGDVGAKGGRAYTLTAEDAVALPRFWAALQNPSVRARASLSVAFRRFHEAGVRPRPEDRLIDLLIVAEALALNVPFDSSDPREMAYRLALRTGSSLAEHRARREFDRHIRLAYLVRNDVVNGAPPRLPDNVSLEAFLGTTEDLLRQALHRAVALAGAPPP